MRRFQLFLFTAFASIFFACNGGGGPTTPDQVPDPSKLPRAEVGEIISISQDWPLPVVLVPDYMKLVSGFGHTAKITINHAAWPNRRLNIQISSTFFPSIIVDNRQENGFGREVEYGFFPPPVGTIGKIMVRLEEIGEGLTAPHMAERDFEVGTVPRP